MVSEDRKYLVIGIVALLILIVYAQTGPVSLFSGNDNPKVLKPEVKLNQNAAPYQREAGRSDSAEVNPRVDKYECFICQEKKSGLLGLFGEPSLAGGECNFQTFDEQGLRDKLTENKAGKGQNFVVNFLLGQGPNFFAYDSANQFCSSNLGFAVKWATNTKDGRAPQPASKATSTCFLRQNVFPVYVYYSEGKHVTYDDMKKFVKEIKDVGPVIVTTEAEYDGSMAGSIKEQIRAISDNCPKCLIGVFPKDMGPNFAKTGDMNALLKVIDEKDVYKRVAFVVQGTVANRYDFCESEEAPIRMLNLSRNILNKTGLPTLYVYYGAYEGRNKYGTCTFDKNVIAKNFDYIGANIPALEEAGILGIGYVMFSDYVPDPNVPKLPPTLSDEEVKAVGLVDKNGEQKTPYFNKWFNNCDYYYENIKKGRSEPATGDEEFRQVPLCYSSAGSNASLQFASVLTSYSIYRNYGDIRPEDKQPLAAQPLKFSCAECLGNPGPFVDGIDIPIKEATNKKDELCNTYSIEIGSSASKCDLDPLFIRAIIWQESSFNQCAVSSGGSGSVNPNEYNSACPSTVTSGACAMGLMQCTDSPSYGSGQGAGCLGSTSQRALSCAGPGGYNPFEPGQSICCGTNELCSLSSKVEEFVNNHESELDTGIQNDLQRRKWMIAWLMAMGYNSGYGGMEKAYDSWVAQKSNGGQATTCSGNKDIADYVCNCPDVSSFLDDQAFPCKVAARYKALNLVCDNTCSAPIGPSIGPVGHTGVCVVDYAIGQLGCPYLYGGVGGDSGVACTGENYNGQYGDQDACDVSVTGNSGEGEGRRTTFAAGAPYCVTGLCPDNRRSYFDCSGLTSAAYNRCHPELGIPHDAATQCDRATGQDDKIYTHVQYPGGRGLENVLVAGDLIQVSAGTQTGTCSIDSCNCISNHVGMYAGAGKVISSPSTCGRVRVDTLEEFLRQHQPFGEACHFNATATPVAIGNP